MNLHQIAFLNRGKVTKTEAAKLIVELAADYPDAVPKLGLLMALHQPPTPKTSTAFAWVAKAVAGPKELCKCLQYIMCDGIQAVATDGTICLVAPCTDKAPGLYDPKTGERVWLLESNYPTPGDTPSGHPGKFPDWQRIMPRSRTLSNVEPTSLSHRLFGKDPVVGVANGSWVKQTQWNNVTMRCNRISEGDKPHVDALYFEGPNGEQAVVMPFRQNYIESQTG